MGLTAEPIRLTFTCEPCPWVQGAWLVHDGGSFKDHTAMFFGALAEQRACAYAQWLNTGAAYQRRKNDPGYGR
jgi:hypothetical protein